MATTSMLRAKGLHLFNNYLSEIPEGALLDADNTVIDRDGTIEPRRGIHQYGEIGTTSADLAKQLLVYKDRILAHYSSTLAWDDGVGNFTDYGTAFAETQAGLRIKSVEANGNLYVTTSEGVRKLATDSQAGLGTAAITFAGGIKAITGTATCDYTVEGFLPGYSKVAYRITWITEDINGNLIEGAPSPAIEVTNQSAQACRVVLTFQVPNGITTDYSYRIYRTNVAVQSGTPTFAGISTLQTGDEMRLVIESPYVSGTSITVVDETPEDFRNNGVNLYTNEFSGEGINQSNEPPPFAKDIALYKNAVFFSNTRTRHFLQISLLGLSAFKSYGGLQDAINITSITYLAPDTTITFSADHGLTVGTRIVVLESGSALDGVQIITDVPTSSTIVVEADSTGANASTTSIYGSSIAIVRGANPPNYYYFVGRPEVNSFTLPAKAALATVGTADYIRLYASEDSANYVFWFDTNGTVDEPVVAGAILVRVDVTDAGIVTAANVADKLADTISENSFDFLISDVTGPVVQVQNSNSGSATDATVTGTIAVVKDQNGHGENAALHYVRLSTYLSPAQSIDDTGRSLAKVITANASEYVNAFYLFDPNGLPGNLYLQSRDLDPTPFFITASDATTGAAFNPDLSTPTSSGNEESNNRIYYSKPSQPEAVPLLNYQPVGPKDKKILRIIALRDSLFILKEEAVYRLTGDSSTNYSITIFDNSANLTAPDTAVVLNNQIYCLTTQGIATISETGVSIISRPIESVFNTVMSPAFTNYKTISFATAYESDRAYLIAVPSLPTDENATRIFRFNTFTQTWTYWSKEVTCAIVEPSINKLYIGAGDTNLVEVERKELTRDDYADRQYQLAIPVNSIVNGNVTLSSGVLVEPGDSIIQLQYLTVGQVERLAKKIALDTAVPDTVGNQNKDFYRNFDIAIGGNIQTRLSALITQLNADVGGAFDTTYSSDFETLQGEFNALVVVMNSSALLNQTNYQGSIGTAPVEILVQAKVSTNIVTPLALGPIVQGAVTHYKAIKSSVVWAPSSFGDPSLYKHIRQGTVLFDTAGIAFATIGYNSDLSPNFEDIPFLMEGDGSWGGFFYSSTTWGGEGTARPFRTLIPRQKQRCRFIRARFQHSTAFYRYSILGISYTYEIYGERAYK